MLQLQWLAYQPLTGPSPGDQSTAGVPALGTRYAWPGSRDRSPIRRAGWCWFGSHRRGITVLSGMDVEPVRILHHRPPGREQKNLIFPSETYVTSFNTLHVDIF